MISLLAISTTVFQLLYSPHVASQGTYSMSSMRLSSPCLSPVAISGLTCKIPGGYSMFDFKHFLREAYKLKQRRPQDKKTCAASYISFRIKKVSE
ncbi:hypothetical protein PanWU01x14_291720 [Parasponia andersonii]|uniref:Secreted protein n=1 Tax=Parasponia andersonii TaxID=3476 RepID=A0A2P5AXA9_PARAD|nr:hypothetical protein PanWU01x14_291720 [Parasponia andersonii]